MQRSIDTTVLGGLPIEVTFTTTGYDNRDVGGGDANEIDEWYISALAGRTLKNYDWIYKRLSSSDEESILDACYDSMY